MNYFLIVINNGEKDGISLKFIILDMRFMNVLKIEKDAVEEMIDEDGIVRRVIEIVLKFDIYGIYIILLQCRYCDYISFKRYLLMRYMKSYLEDKLYKCNICDRGFKIMVFLQNYVNIYIGI